MPEEGDALGDVEGTLAREAVGLLELLLALSSVAVALLELRVGVSLELLSLRMRGVELRGASLSRRAGLLRELLRLGLEPRVLLRLGL